MDPNGNDALSNNAETSSQRLFCPDCIESWRVNQTEVVRITRELCLPAFEHDPHRLYVWPRSRLNELNPA